MNRRLKRLIKTVLDDANVDNVLAFTGTNGATNTATMYVDLKPRGQRKLSAQQVIAQIRKQATKQAGLSLYLQAQQDLTIGGRSANAEYQYTLMSNDLDLLMNWAPKLLAKLRQLPQLTDVSSDQQYKGLAANLTLDRNTASRLGLSTHRIDNTLYDAFGQREVSTMYTQLNQYYVVMEVAPQFWQNPDTLQLIHLASNVAQPVFHPFEPVRIGRSDYDRSVKHAQKMPAHISRRLRECLPGFRVRRVPAPRLRQARPLDMIGGVSSTTGSSTANLVTSGSTISALPGVTSTSSDRYRHRVRAIRPRRANPPQARAAAQQPQVVGKSIILGNSSTPNNGVTIFGTNLRHVRAGRGHFKYYHQ